MSGGPNYCSNCGEKLDENLKTNECPKCHSALHEHSKHIETAPRIVEQLPYKSPGTTALIAFLGGIFGLPGIGHMYVGMVKRGILILIGGLVIYIIIVFSSIALNATELLSSVQSWVVIIVVCIGGYIALFIWQIFDAREFAKKFNESVKATGKEPW